MGAASAFLPPFFACGSPSPSPASSLPPSVFLLYGGGGGGGGGGDHQRLVCRSPLTSIASPLSHRAPSLPFSARAAASSSSSSANEEQRIKENVSTNPVVVYSKSYCPYCLRVKGLFKDLGVKPFVVELDEISGGNEIQGALQRLTGQYTVPNVFIGGKHIGGCDDTVALHQRGKLVPLLKDSGLNVSQ